MRAFAAFASVCLVATIARADPSPAFLDVPKGHQALQWVGRENARTFRILEHDPHEAAFAREALAIAEARDRIATPELQGEAVYNFWQDPSHVRGIWRRTTLAGYRSGKPDWTTVLDLDALAAREHANWVWKGADCAAPSFRRCLISLSDGGEDATTVREFDTVTRDFVPGGFVSPRSKQDIDWDGENAVLVARDWGPGTMSASGYAFVLKRLARGRKLSDATEVFRGNDQDVEVDGGTLVDGDGGRATVITESYDAFRSRFLLRTAHGLVPIALPERSRMIGLVAGRLLFKVDEDWHATNGTHVPAGSLVALRPDNKDGPRLVLAPQAGDAIDDVAVTKDAVVVSLYHDVRGQGWVVRPAADGAWSERRLPLPDNASVGIEATSSGSATAFFSVTGFLTPSQVWAADDGGTVAVASMPTEFDASGMTVEQDWVVSNDGTRVPYFLVHAKTMRLDGRNPTELYAYGGFLISMTPRYDPTLGRLWLAHGGVYALANIRGGGEFGPVWHDAALGTNRQHAYDDFAAVGRDLVRRGVTDPRHLGIRGGSNGGLLAGVEFTEHPELWHAAVIEVPLLDMMNFETMAAGASWTGEYGSDRDPSVRAFWAKTSPLQNLRAGVDYPEPFLFTTTKDDRVGPVHARRFAWRLTQLKRPFLYYEDIEGGHAAGANLEEAATERALVYTYLARQLIE